MKHEWVGEWVYIHLRHNCFRCTHCGIAKTVSKNPGKNDSIWWTRPIVYKGAVINNHVYEEPSCEDMIVQSVMVS